MYVFIKGTLVQASPMAVTIETHGIGYRVAIPASVFSRLPQVGEILLLHTSFVIRENSQALYGFLNEQDRDLFEAFMDVSGIGPKTALSLIGHMNVHDIGSAITRNDIAPICKVPGIGKKTAERLMIEMRDKWHTLLPSTPSEFTLTVPLDPQPQLIQDAMSALIHLGYNQMTAQRAIKKTLKEAPTIEDLAVFITAALKNV